MNATALAEAIGGKRQRKSGGGWVVCCPAHADRSPSLSIDDGEDGRVLLRCFAGCSQDRIITALRSNGWWGGSSEADYRPLTDDERQARQAERERDCERRSAEAQAVWAACQVADGTLAETYLRCRGITIPVPPSILYHAALRHAPTGLALPAMVAAVQGPDRQITGIHRTFLTADGRGKAPVSQNKMMLGVCTGGAVRLAAAAEEICIAEGIETALSVQQETGLPTWAALSAGGIEGLILPVIPLASEVVIAADNDASGRGQEAAAHAAHRWIAEGRRVRVAIPPNSDTDFNDILCAATSAAGVLLCQL
jgi:putative DNA primase/helicase